MDKHKIIYLSVPSAIIPVTQYNEISQPVSHDFRSDDVFQESLHFLMPVHYERLGGEDKDMEHLIENSSDSNDTGNGTDFDDIPTLNPTSSMAQPDCFHQSELNDPVRDLCLSKELEKWLASRLS